MATKKRALTIYKEIHEKMLMTYSIDINKHKKAKDIQNFFMKIKSFKTGAQNLTGVDKILYDKVYEPALNNLNQYFKTIDNNSPGLQSLLTTQHNKSDIYGQGVDELSEREISAILSSFSDLIQNKTTEWVVDEYVVGGESTNIKTPEKFTENQQKIFDKLNKIFSDDKITLGKLNSVSGKIDVMGLDSNITLSFKANNKGIDDDIENFTKILKGATFTVKNYSSNSIHLGKTNPYRAIIATLGNLGYSFEDSLDIFYHGYNSYSYHSKKNNLEYAQNVSRHINHLRASYELRGDGLYSSNNDFKKLSGADYIIYNNPSGEIYVESTEYIINKLFLLKNSTWDRVEPYKAIAITPKQLIELTKEQ